MITLNYAKIVDLNIKPTNQREWLEFLESNEGKDVQIKRTTYIRTTAQNNALHKWFEMVAEALSMAGFQFHMKLGSKEVKLEWTPNLVKEAMWKPIQRALLGKSSTTELDKVEDINAVYDHINRFLGEELKIHIPFPHKEKVEAKVLETNEDHLLDKQIL